MNRTRLGLIFIAFVTQQAMAFNPPEDTSGPLKLRIEGPAIITSTETPILLSVELTNISEDPLQGTVRIQVTDAWRVEPSTPVPFQLGKKVSSKIEFTAVAGKGSYSALYPIHAFAEFEAGGVKNAAHAVLIVSAQLADAPRPPTMVPWRPIVVPANGALSLPHSPIYRAVVQVFGEAPHVMTPGWRGSDGRTRGCVEPGVQVARPDMRESLGIHPPWYEGLAGTLWVEYPLQLPGTTPITLRFANAIRDTTAQEPPSDGVTFRVRAVSGDAPEGDAGEVLFEKHTDAKTWQEGEADLSRFAGKSIRLQLESHPGPKKDVTCDASYWAAPRIVAGTPTPPRSATLSEERLLGVVRTAGSDYDVRVRPGARGLLDGEITFSGGGKELSFRGFRARVLGDQIDEASGVTELLGLSEEGNASSVKVRHRFRNWIGAFDLVAELRIEEGKSLRAHFSIENGPEPRPWQVVYIEDLAAGSWNAVPHQVYAGVGNVVREPQAFDLGFDSHQLATSFVGFDFKNGFSLVQAVDVSPNKLEVQPEARFATLHAPLAQTLTFIPAPNVWAAAKAYRETDARKAAGGVETLKGRFVFDLWGGAYKVSAEALKTSFKYGLTHSVVVWHNWQRWGYDYRLPDIYPPNPEFGTLEEFRDLAKVCKEQGVIFAPHDNYIDLYPDAEGFTYKNVAFSRDGEPVRGWLNEGCDAQAYRWRSDAYRPFMEHNVKLIKENFQPTGYFIDVFSSIGPYESWTCDGGFQDRVFTRDTWGETFAWIRNELGGSAPQISEGGHDQLIGYLDGSQANHLRVDANPPKDGGWLVWRIKCADAERIPWFDVAYHDRFVAHGAGYSYRYQGGLDAPLHGIYSDDYMTAEVMTGHPPMVSEPFNRNVVRKYWFLHGLANRLAGKLIDTVEFVDNDLHRQHIAYAGGADEIWINRGAADWEVKGHVLPPFGFLAMCDSSFLAGITRSKEGVIAEWSCAGNPVAECYVNARPVVDESLPVEVSCNSIRYLGDRKIELALDWDASKPLTESLQAFVHFVDDSGKILFQADHSFEKPTTQWQGLVQSKAVTTIPPTIASGAIVELRVGLWRPDLGIQLLPGFNDDGRRVRLGMLKVDGQGDAVTGVTWTPIEPRPDPLLARMNPEGKPVSFFDGKIVTNGAFRLNRVEDVVVITPLPGGASFTTRLAKDLLSTAGPDLPVRAERIDANGQVLQTFPLTYEDNALVFSCESGAFEYRLAK